MPAPYSDNMYSGDYDVSDDEHDAQDALSPTDGYFHASSTDQNLSTQSPHQSPTEQQPQNQRTSSQVPFVPNVLVEDPTLRQESQGAAKAREAQLEGLRNQQSPDPTTPSSPSAIHQTNESIASSQPSRPQTSATVTGAAPTSPTHHHRRSVEEDTPLFAAAQPSLTAASQTEVHPVGTHFGQPHQQADAPPAYTPSSPTSTQGQGYQTFASAQSPTMGVPNEYQSLLSRHPESMGGPPEPKQPIFQRVKNSIFSWKWRSSITTILGITVIFLIISALVFDEGQKDPDFIHEEPVKSPDPSQGNGDMKWPIRTCRLNPVDKSTFHYDLTFSTDKKVEFIQTIEDKDGPHTRSPNVSGQLRLRPLSDSSERGSIEIQVSSNDKDMVVQSHVDRQGQKFKLVTPRDYDMIRFPKTRPCIHITATIWVPPKAYIGDLLLDMVHLDLKIDDGLILGATGRVSAKLVSGDIGATLPLKDDRRVVPYTLESREVVLETISGDVSGWYPLYDLLKIHSVSGDITIDVGPKKADTKNQKPAKLDIASTSGDCKIKEPLDRALGSATPSEVLPLRDYVVKMETVSGDLEADLAFSSTSYFETKSGTYKLKLLPILEAKTSPRIHTSSASGDLNLDVLEPLWTGKATIGGHGSRDTVPSDDSPFIIIHPDVESVSESEASMDEVSVTKTSDKDKAGSLKNLESDHSSISGTLKVRLPPSWEGSFSATSMSGKKHINGKGVVIDENKGWLEKTIKGHKGDGKSKLTMSTVSGDQSLQIGEQ